MGRKDGVTVMWLAMLCDDCYTLATMGTVRRVVGGKGRGGVEAQGSGGNFMCHIYITRLKFLPFLCSGFFAFHVV